MQISPAATSDRGDRRAAGRAAGIRVAGAMAAAYVVAVAVLAALGALVVPPAPTEGLDRWVTRTVADRRGSVADAVSSGLSELADPFTIVGAAAGAVVVLLALGRSHLAVAVLVALPLELAVFLTVATVFDRPRPAVEPLDPVPFTGSYPSGHTAAAVALYGSLAWLVRRSTTGALPRRLATLVAVAVPLGVGAARIYRGMHHLTDVVVGLALGSATLAVGVVCADRVARLVAPPDPGPGP